eukprot:CAMPEP_0114524638 /NCGR_PEP_ID=MMETSP0109-20121206/21969_1 /TAXON_ID=29199 /ORGANISM="Chlorarachnion reptans, Strain CCCM449" /LENGTH=288 /DNA_ID=CAMNT_0001706109 /DNA_START=923 /DNA_END=1784 /DNA_ORIENTATION=-
MGIAPIKWPLLFSTIAALFSAELPPLAVSSVTDSAPPLSTALVLLTCELASSGGTSRMRRWKGYHPAGGETHRLFSRQDSHSYSRNGESSSATSASHSSRETSSMDLITSATSNSPWLLSAGGSSPLRSILPLAPADIPPDSSARGGSAEDEGDDREEPDVFGEVEEASDGTGLGVTLVPASSSLAPPEPILDTAAASGALAVWDEYRLECPPEWMPQRRHLRQAPVAADAGGGAFVPEASRNAQPLVEPDRRRSRKEGPPSFGGVEEENQGNAGEQEGERPSGGAAG